MHAPMDKLRIVGLEVSARIGIHAWEQQVRQRLSVDLELETDAARAAASDDIADALDYGIIARDVADFVRTSECHLIETLAERIAQRVLDGFPVARLKVCVHKPGAVSGARDTSIEIERSRVS
jgi:7,8-dihydroneopterin aldolase/epimerase/oxygenase